MYLNITEMDILLPMLDYKVLPPGCLLSSWGAQSKLKGLRLAHRANSVGKWWFSTFSKAASCILPIVTWYNYICNGDETWNSIVLLYFEVTSVPKKKKRPKSHTDVSSCIMWMFPVSATYRSIFSRSWFPAQNMVVQKSYKSLSSACFCSRESTLN